MSDPGNKAVFLSYASQDAETAKRICEALRAGGVEVWFDQNELVGGDAWDAKIRKQIAECALFVPIISSNTQARREGYFRIEWRLAAQRTHAMSDDTAFLLPVVIDDTNDAEARVPVEFKNVQWTRLSGGETTPAFCARVKKLLDGDGTITPAVSAEARSAAPTPARRKVAWMGYGWAAVGIVFALVYELRPFWRETRSHSPQSPPTASAAAETEAQRLVARARDMLERSDEMNRENYALIEDLLRRAEALDVTEASAWSLHAWLSADLYRYGLDRNEARLAQTQAQASRAISLAPSSLDAQLAVLRAQTQTAAGGNVTDITKRQAELADRFPDDPRVYRLYGLSHSKDSVTFKMLERGLARWPNDVRLQGDMINSLLLAGRYAEADEFAERVTRGSAGVRVLAAQAFIRLWWRGDPASAAAGIVVWPSWFLQEDRGAGIAAMVALRNRAPQVALDLLGRITRDYLHDSFYTGPRSALKAWAHEAAGQSESAEAEWRVAVQVCDRELATNPQDAAALHWKAWALTRLGEKDEARKIFRVLVQRSVKIEGLPQVAGGLAGLALLLDEREEALHEIARLWNYDDGRTRLPTRALFDLNPVFDPLRGDPRFQKLRDAAPAPATSTSAPAHVIDEKSVAVLAFANLSDDKGNEYFSDGISEELLNVLAKVPGLTVRGRSSGFFFKGKQTRSAEIGQQLNVRYLVQGSVRRAGDRVRISAQLIRAENDDVVWSSGSLDRDLKDIFAVQDEIAGLIAKNLSLTMGVPARAQHQVKPEALTALLEGRQFWVLRTTEGFARAGELFKQAIALDPEWAPAHAALANLMTIEASYIKGGGESVSERFARAAREAQRAIELDPTLGEPHAALGKIAMEDRRLTEAEEEFHRALALEPNNALVHDWYGDLLVTRGRLDLAIAEYQKAAEIEPLSPYILWDVAWELMHVRRFGEALALIERAAALTPSGAARLSLRRARLLLELGRKTEAEVALKTYLESPRSGSDPQFANEAVWCLDALSSPAERERWTTELLRQYPDSFASGVILLMRGDTERAYPLLERTPTIFQQQLYWDPVFDAVRDTPHFQQLLEKLGCVAEYKVARETLARLLKQESKK